jgi:hypothetical protein
VCVCVCVKRCLPHWKKKVDEVCKNKMLTGFACEDGRRESYIMRNCLLDKLFLT